jgi:hypothetical protein
VFVEAKPLVTDVTTARSLVGRPAGLADADAEIVQALRMDGNAKDLPASNIELMIKVGVRTAEAARWGDLRPPRDVEDVLLRHPPVREVAAVGVPDHE